MEVITTFLLHAVHLLIIWCLLNYIDLDSTIEFDSGFTATSILHPATYLNKVLVSSSQGSMQLWNIRSQSVLLIALLVIYRWHTLALDRTCIHKFTSSRLLSSPNQINTSANVPASAITALTQSPAIDVVGIGFVSGEISVYDVRADERLMRMFMEGGGINALGFRSGM
jgi:U3 small nucleolar RNA-associated protein 21